MISAVWRGERPLWELFWLWYLLGGALVTAACIVVAFFVLASIEPTVLPWLTIFVGPVLSIPYQILILVGLARGVARAESAWRYPALAFVVLVQMMAPIVLLSVPFAVKW